MFLCVSPNPAIDKRLNVSSLGPGTVIRARSARGHAGGKATHVAMVLRTLGEAPHWVGFCGGAAGAELISGLTRLGIEAHPCFTSAETRSNLEIVEDNGRVTEILEPGGALTSSEVAALEDCCRNFFAQYRGRASVIFSGSLPPGTPHDLYARLIALAQEYQCLTFLDTSGEPLRLALTVRPDFVKPNRQEAGAMLGTSIHDLSDGVRAISKLIGLGARAAALSLGAEGLLYCAGEGAPVLFAPAAKVQVRSTVGCGDSAMAGFAYAIVAGRPPGATLRLAAACATANCMADSPGAARADDIHKVGDKIAIHIQSPYP